MSGCDFSARFLKLIDQHLSEHHKRNMEVEILHVKDETELKTWLNTLCETDFVKYIKKHGQKAERCYYYCHRSSASKQESKGSGKRAMKKSGSIVSAHVCTSRIITEPTETGIKVTYHKSHSGHSLNPGCVGLTSPVKQNVAKMLESGVPKMKALETLRASNPTEINRAGISNMQDIRNINSKYKIDSDVRLDSDDARSVDMLVKKLNNDGDTGVFLYKPVGQLSKEHPEFSESEFVLGYMNEGQEVLLKTLGNNIICIDGTHGTNAYGFELSTVLVLDENHQGFPVMFVYHSSKTEETYRGIFSALKARVGKICCRVFMSDDEPALYNAWSSMGQPGIKLLCSWHVLKNWKHHLAGLSKETKDEVFKRLRAIMCSVDQLTFEEGLQGFLEYLTKSELHTFRNYFEKHYCNRKTEWAYCHRVGAGINTNMHIENMHRQIKHIHFLGKKIYRMDLSFSTVLKFLRSKQQDRLATIYRGKLTPKDKVLRECHKRSLSMRLDSVFCGIDCWEIASTQNPFATYKVVRGVKPCPCLLICPECKVCIHAFRCECPESSVRFNMCKHIHLLQRYLAERGQDAETCADKYQELEEGLIIDTDPIAEAHNTESRAHFQDLRRAKKFDDIQLGHQAIRDCVEKAIELATTPEAVNRLLGQIKGVLAHTESFSDKSSMKPPKVVEQITPNQNAEPQLRFQPKKKKRIPATSTQTSSEILAGLILPRKLKKVGEFGKEYLKFNG